MLERFIKGTRNLNVSCSLFITVRKSTPLQTYKNTRILLFAKYKNKFTNIFVKYLTFANTCGIIRT